MKKHMLTMQSDYESNVHCCGHVHEVLHALASIRPGKPTVPAAAMSKVSPAVVTPMPQQTLTSLHFYSNKV